MAKATFASFSYDVSGVNGTTLSKSKADGIDRINGILKIRCTENPRL
jgi:hypothetical protein